MSRYTNVVLTVIAVALLIIAFRPTTKADAGLDVPEFKAGEKLGVWRIPRKWGRFVGVTGTGSEIQLWFEASDGTIRRSGCPNCEYIRSN